MKKGKFFLAFSLLEILISVIVISTILATLVPVITKKLTARMVYVGDVTSTEEEAQEEYIYPESQDDCPGYTVYVAGRAAGDEVEDDPEREGVPGYCVTKWNIGDDVESGIDDFRLGSTALPTNVKLNTSTLEYDPNGTELIVYTQAVGETGSCNANSQTASTTDFTTGNKLCCWNSGVTSGNYETSYGTSTYSGGERALCTWHAAVALCENWAPEGFQKGDWHLPTNSQLSVWSSNLASLNTNQGADGLQLCDYNSGYGAARCYALAISYSCVQADVSYCYPSFVWSRSDYSGSFAYTRYLKSGSFQYENYYRPSRAFSVRCLAGKVPKNLSESAPVTKEEKTETIKTDSADDKKQITIEIPAGIKSAVIKDIYSPGGNGGKGYILDIGLTQTIPLTSQADCPSYTKYVNGTCVAKWNLGDNDATESHRDDFRLGSTALPTTVRLNTTSLEYDPEGTELTVYAEAAGVSGSCNASSQTNSTTDFTTGNKLCCWNSGVTSGKYETSSGTSTYSGGERTVCTWHAAVALCENWAPEGFKKGDWSLPTVAQLNYWSTNISSINTNKGSDGLQLCDATSGYGATRCYAHSSACVGAINSYCGPRNVWSRSVYSSSGAYNRYLSSGSFVQHNSYPSYAFSARCVLEQLKLKQIDVICGGGGASGYHISDIEIPSNILTSNVGGKIVIDREYEVSGYSGAAVLVYNSSDDLVWGFRLPKGSNGYDGGASGADPSGGTPTSTGLCSEYSSSTSSWVDSDCEAYSDTNAGNAGSAFVRTEKSTGGVTTTGDISKGGDFGTNAGGLPGDATDINGKNGANYSAGGGGGCGSFTTAGTGGKGGIGYIELEYTYEE